MICLKHRPFFIATLSFFWLLTLLLPGFAFPLGVLVTAAQEAHNYDMPADGSYIREFDSRLTVTKAGQLDVIETISFDFGHDRKHGIYRLIPTRYVRNNITHDVGLRFFDIKADGFSVPYIARQQGNDQLLQIGDPNHLLSGVHTYRVHYTVNRAINFFKDGPEVYWNVIGNETPFFTKKATAEFLLPNGVDGTKIKTTCYKGDYGSRQLGSITRTKDTLTFSAQNLHAGEGLTIVVALPQGTVEPALAKTNELVWFLADWWPVIVFPLATFLLVYLDWYYRGRGAGEVDIAGVDWNPPRGLTPAEVGTLIDQRCDLSDILSILLDLAARGHFRIKEVAAEGVKVAQRDYQFIKTEPKSGDPPLKRHEQLFLFGIFGFSETEATLSSLKGKFCVQLEPIRSDVYTTLQQDGYVSRNPETRAGAVQGLGILCTFVGIALVLSYFSAYGIGLILSGLILIGAAPAMSALTMKGVEATRQALGFKRFVTKAEKERIRVLAADDPTIFGRLLPFAMAVGAADQWASAFQDILQTPPDWYQPLAVDSAVGGLTSLVLMNALGDAIHSCATTFLTGPAIHLSDWVTASDVAAGLGGVAAAGASGFGGFAGGGFGGGGAGSW